MGRFRLFRPGEEVFVSSLPLPLPPPLPLSLSGSPPLPPLSRSPSQDRSGPLWPRLARRAALALDLWDGADPRRGRGGPRDPRGGGGGGQEESASPSLPDTEPVSQPTTSPERERSRSPVYIRRFRYGGIFRPRVKSSRGSFLACRLSAEPFVEAHAPEASGAPSAGGSRPAPSFNMSSGARRAVVVKVEATKTYSGGRVRLDLSVFKHSVCVANTNTSNTNTNTGPSP